MKNDAEIISLDDDEDDYQYEKLASDNEGYKDFSDDKFSNTKEKKSSSSSNKRNTTSTSSNNKRNVVDIASSDEDDEYKRSQQQRLNHNKKKPTTTTTTTTTSSKKSKPSPPKPSSSNKRKTNQSDSESEGSSKRKKKANYDDDSFLEDDSMNFCATSDTSGIHNTYHDIDEVSDSEIQEHYPGKQSKSTKSSSTTTSKKSSTKTTKTKAAKKITKESCLEETFIIFDKTLEREIGFDDIRNQLEANTTPNIKMCSTNIPNSINFLRRTDQMVDGPYETFTIIKYSSKDLVEFIQNEGALVDKIARITKDNPKNNFTLLIEALDQHLLQLSKQSKQAIKKGIESNGSNSSTSNEPIISINRSTIDKILVQIQMEYNFTIRVIENRNDVVNYISKVYNAIALKPLKAEDQLFDGFCAESIKKKGKTSSYTDMWMAQLCQLNGVSQNIARCIVSEYPTYSKLLSFYGNSSPDSEKESLLKSIKIDQTNGTTRNLGLVLSSKIHQIFSSTDPNKIIY